MASAVEGEAVIADFHLEAAAEEEGEEALAATMMVLLQKFKVRLPYYQSFQLSIYTASKKWANLYMLSKAKCFALPSRQTEFVELAVSFSLLRKLTAVYTNRCHISTHPSTWRTSLR